MSGQVGLRRRITGPATLVTELGFGYEAVRRTDRRTFETIDDLAANLGVSLVVSRKGELVGLDYRAAPNDAFWKAGLYRVYTVLDHDDLSIPPHVVLDDLASINRDRASRSAHLSFKRRHWPRDPATYFRNGPIPGALFQRRRAKTYRKSGTFAEVRATIVLETDPDALEAGLRVRGKRSRSSIGDNDWEGVCSFRNADRGWKRHRSTQWKG